MGYIGAEAPMRVFGYFCRITKVPRRRPSICPRQKVGRRRPSLCHAAEINPLEAVLRQKDFFGKLIQFPLVFDREKG